MNKLSDFENVSYNPFKKRDALDSDDSDFDGNYFNVTNFKSFDK